MNRKLQSAPPFEISSDLTDGRILLRLLIDRMTAGMLKACIYGETAYLEEVCVNDEYPRPRSLLDRVLCRPKTRSFRRMGVGSALITEFLSLCRSAGVAQIVGSVVEKDLEETPELLDWYEHRGFERRRPLDGKTPWLRPPSTWEVVYNL